MATTRTFKPSRFPDARSGLVLQGMSNLLRDEIQCSNDTCKVIEQGLPFTAFLAVLERGNLKTLDISWIIPAERLIELQSASGRLSAAESEKLLRLTRILVLSEIVFGSHEKAIAWLKKPRRSFHKVPAIQAIETLTGAQKVEERLWQIDSGFFA